MVKKELRGGAGRGQGKKSIYSGEVLKPVSIRLAESHRIKLKKLGGSNWMRKQIEAAEDQKPNKTEERKIMEQEKTQIINPGPSKEIWDAALQRSGIDPAGITEYNAHNAPAKNLDESNSDSDKK